MSEPIIEYRDEFNVMDFVSKYAERVSRVIDEQTLANVEHQLAEYGYVKVVRCRDCDYRRRHWNGHCPNFKSHFFCAYTGGHEVKPDGFCAWGERRANGN